MNIKATQQQRKRIFDTVHTIRSCCMDVYMLCVCICVCVCI